MKAMRPWLLRILNSHWLRVSHAPALGLHEGVFGPQLITSLVDEKPTWNPTWQP